MLSQVLKVLFPTPHTLLPTCLCKPPSHVQTPCSRTLHIIAWFCILLSHSLSHDLGQWCPASSPCGQMSGASLVRGYQSSMQYWPSQGPIPTHAGLQNLSVGEQWQSSLPPLPHQMYRPEGSLDDMTPQVGWPTSPGAEHPCSRI